METPFSGCRGPQQLRSGSLHLSTALASSPRLLSSRFPLLSACWLQHSLTPVDRWCLECHLSLRTYLKTGTGSLNPEKFHSLLDKLFSPSLVVHLQNEHGSISFARVRTYGLVRMKHLVKQSSGNAHHHTDRLFLGTQFPKGKEQNVQWKQFPGDHKYCQF